MLLASERSENDKISIHCSEATPAMIAPIPLNNKLMATILYGPILSENIPLNIPPKTWKKYGTVAIILVANRVN